MATVSFQMDDELRQKAQQLATEQGVSLDAFVNATIQAAISQQESIRFLEARLENVDTESLHERVMTFMKKTRPGQEPTVEEIERARRE